MNAPDGALERQIEGLSTLVQLEQEARQAEQPVDLGFVMVNETYRLVPYRHAFLWRQQGRSRSRLANISGTTQFEKTAPMALWLSTLGDELSAAPHNESAHELTAADVKSGVADGWAEWLPEHLLAIPLVAPTGRRLGILAIARPSPWSDAEKTLLRRLTDAYAHAWHALEPKGPSAGQRLQRAVLSKGAAVLLLALAGGALFLPVRQSALAPAEVIPVNPSVISAPLDGVIKEFLVRPNQKVVKQQVLFRVDDTNLRNRRNVAHQTLLVAQAELDRIEKRAFLDPEAKSQVAVLKARVAERRAELVFTEEQLARLEVRADRSGIAVFKDANDWIGRPASTGERILIIADPGEVELQMQLPADDLLLFSKGARVQAFLNVAPLSPREAILQTMSYEPEPTEQGILSYRLTARFRDAGPLPRIGHRGTAKVFGEKVTLFWFLMRKPVSSARRMSGL